jgi:hypothetical protein
VNASSRDTYAQASLKEILKTMDAVLLDRAEVTIDLIGTNLSPRDITGDPAFASSLIASLKAMIQSCPQDRAKRIKKQNVRSIPNADKSKCI